MTLTMDVVSSYWAHAGQPLDDDARKAAKIALADGLAVMIAATRLETATRPFTDYATEVGEQGRSTIIANGEKRSAVSAALANGALAHALDFEDTFEAGMIHPNASLIPAVLALAQSEGASGLDLVDALVIGCDFSCRLALSLDGDPAKRGWYHPPILSGLGATLGAAWLAGLTAQQATDALGLFTAQFMLGDELKRSPDSDLRAVREGLAARAAVEAVLLARHGVRAVEQPLEGKSGVFALLTGNPPHTASLLDNIGTRWHGPDVALKRWPCCRGTHSAVAAALHFRKAGVTPDRIAKVAVTATPPNDMLFEPRASRIAPRSAIEAKFSIPYVFAAVMSQGAVSLASFAPEKLSAPETLDLARHVEMAALVESVAFEAIYVLTMTDGTTVEHVVDPIPGWRTGDASLDDLWPKVADCMKTSASPISLEAYFCALHRIETDGIAPLMDMV